MGRWEVRRREVGDGWVGEVRRGRGVSSVGEEPRSIGDVERDGRTSPSPSNYNLGARGRFGVRPASQLWLTCGPSQTCAAPVSVSVSVGGPSQVSLHAVSANLQKGPPLYHKLILFCFFDEGSKSVRVRVRLTCGPSQPARPIRPGFPFPRATVCLSD